MNNDAEKLLQRIIDEINKQSEDELLWSQTITPLEAHLQNALRRLHLIIEGEM